MAVSYQPWYVGQTFPSWDIPLTTDGGADDLTGVDITKFTLYFRNANGQDTAGTGTFSVKTISPAEVLYKPSLTDVAAVFSGSLIIKAFYPPSGTSADEVVFDPITPFVISAD
jgi:hypothetical protein